MKSTFWFNLLMLALAIVFAFAAWLLSLAGFNTMQSVRQIERIPVSDISSALPGEIKINARAIQYENLLSSYHFKQPSIYYRYRYEEEVTDSDGDTSWETRFETEQMVSFLLKDETGSIQVNLEANPYNLKISLPTSQQITQGTQRYTEWRIEPNASIFVMGMLVGSDANSEINFTHPGHYLPVISRYDEQHEKSDLGIGLILKICAGISLMGFAAFFLTSGLNIHRIIVFLLILSFSIIVPLSHLGVSMLYQDITTGNQRLSKQAQQAMEAINSTIFDYSTPAKDWPQLIKNLEFVQSRLEYAQQHKANNILLNYAFSQNQYLTQLKVFPANLIASFYNEKPSSIIELFSATQQYQFERRLNEFQKTQTQGLTPIVLSVVGLLICVFLTWYGFRLIRLKRHIENLPTSKTSGLVYGLSEIKGRVIQYEQENALTSPLTNSQCYWYHYTVQEKQGSGDNAKWVTIENDQQHATFYCQDAYGKIKVSPNNAEIISTHKKTERQGNRRYTELTLKLNDKIYLLGMANIDRETGDRLEIRGHKNERPYLITNLSEQQVMMKKARGGMLSLTAAFSGLMFAALFILGMRGNFSPADYLQAALIAPVYMSLVVLVLHYNDLIFLKQRASRNFANIMVALQKRFDLIPNLEKIAKQYFDHERELLTQITAMRTHPTKATDSVSDINNQLVDQQQVLSQMIARAEGYPVLKGYQPNLILMNKLIDLENEVALMREGYNDAVTYYNTRISSVPDIFFARIFGFKSADLFQAEPVKMVRLTLD